MSTLASAGWLGTMLASAVALWFRWRRGVAVADATRAEAALAEMTTRLKESEAIRHEREVTYRTIMRGRDDEIARLREVIARHATPAIAAARLDDLGRVLSSTDHAASGAARLPLRPPADK